MIAGHNLLDNFHAERWQGPHSAVPGLGSKMWMVLHQGFSVFPVAGFPSPIVVIVYPLIPWVGVMAAGYAFGSLYQKDFAVRRRLLLTIGAALTGLFVVLRAFDVYGDAAKWSGQKNLLFTVFSFVNTTKYPPSLLFLLMTLGPAILALALFETGPNDQPSNGLIAKLRKAFVTFGRVPLFFYILQWYTAHLLAVLIEFMAGQSVSYQFASPIDKFGAAPPNLGFRIWVVYLVWIAGVLLLYPLCKWFAGVKARRRDWWLSYL
jgi:uncharacterized membrane protein